MSGFYTSVERDGSNILWNGYENGTRFSRKVKFEPTLFVPTKNESSYKGLINKKPLAPKKFSSMNEAKDFIEQYKDVSGFEIHGSTNFISNFIQEKYPGKINFEIELINLVKFDIEVDISTGLPNMETADKPITSISYKSSRNSTYHLLTMKEYDKTQTITDVHPDNINHMSFTNESSLLRRFIDIWVMDYPDIVTGWNVEFFDITYIVGRITRVLGESAVKKLSPWGVIRKRTAVIFNREQITYSFHGITVIDFMDAFKKFGYKYGPQESYKLDHIASVVLDEKKLDYSEYGSLTALYEQNPQLYFDYSLKDTVLIEKLEEETALIALVLEVAYNGGVNFGDAFGTVHIWESILYRWQLEQNIVPPIKRGPGEITSELPGGHVKVPKPGFSKNMLSFDLDSLYPHLMMQYNMSPETFIPNHSEMVSIPEVLAGNYKNTTQYAVSGNGACFTKEFKGMIPTIVEEYYANRKAVKKEMLGVEQEMEIIKTLMQKRGLKV